MGITSRGGGPRQSPWPAALAILLFLVPAAAWGADPRGAAIAAGAGPGGVASSCMTCHGPRGEGQPASGFPRLAGLPARYLAKQLDDYANGQRPNEIMTPIARELSERDRFAVAAHYASIRPDVSPPAAPTRRDPARAQHGGAIFAQGSPSLGVQACINCHGPGGAGLGPAYPPIAGQPAAYTEAQLRAWREGTRVNDMAESMRTIARRLSDDDIAALAHFIEGLKP